MVSWEDLCSVFLRRKYICIMMRLEESFKFFFFLNWKNLFEKYMTEKQLTFLI